MSVDPDDITRHAVYDSGSVTIFGAAVEISGEEKREVLHAFLRKFLSEEEYQVHQAAGKEYIEKSLNRTKLIKIKIEHMTGKRGNQ